MQSDQVMKRTLTAACAATVAVTLAPMIARAARTSYGRRRPSVGRFPDLLVIAHRGASGYRPEHTLAAYECAVAMGADYIEPDLVVTKDGVLVARHEPDISETTNVASRPEFADRRATKTLDGRKVTGWFTEDFALAELKTLRAVERMAKVRTQNTAYDGLFDVPTYEEVLRLRTTLAKRHGRPVGVIPEIKHSTYFHDAGLDPERPFVALTTTYDLNNRCAPMWLQSFEVSNLQRVRTLGYRANSTLLACTGDGPLIGPYDRLTRGDARTYSDWLTPAGLQEISRFADGIGPEKSLVIPAKADGTLGTPTSLVADAHRMGLAVMPWAFRNENRYMAKDFWNGEDPNDHGKAVQEQVVYLRTGIDGLFTDNPDTGVEARARFIAGD